MEKLPLRLKRARKLRGVSQVELARGCGLSQPSIANIEAGTNARSRALPEIAAFLRISYDWLKTGKGSMDLRSSPSVDGALRMIPLRSAFDLAVEVPMSEAASYLPAPVSCGPRTFAVTVEGDAMLAHGPRSYPNGTIIYVDPDKSSNLNGKRVLARSDGQVVFREYRKDAGTVYLMPLNPQYRAISPETVEIIGQVIGSYTPE